LADEQAAPEHWPEALIYRLSKPAWSKVATTVNPSGIAAVFALPAIQENCADLAELPTLVLVGMSDPGNVGTLLRSAAAFAWKQVVVVGGADPFAPKVVNASVGAMAALRLWRCPADLAPESLAAKGALHALVARDGVHPRALRIGAAPFVVVGNEAHGLPEHWIRAARHRVTLPMAEGVESLNAAMAGTVACWALSSLA
jgi:TrmH family RNA methyltransferase